jgi:hypothetical protein
MRRLFFMLPNRTPFWVLLPVLDRDYRRLVWWSYRLVVKVRLVSWAVTVAHPVATPWLTGLLNRRAEAVSEEVQGLKRCIRARHRRPAVAPIRPTSPGNPWIW